MSVLRQKRIQIDIPDTRVYYTLDGDFKIINQLSYICFGSLGTENLNSKFKNPKVKYIRYDFISGVSNIVLRYFLNLWANENLFRNVSVEIFNAEDISKFNASIYGFGEDRGKDITKRLEEGTILAIKLIADIKKVSAQEVMFVGFILRQLSNHPKVIYNFFRLLKKHPEEDKLRLFILAHKLKLPSRSSKESLESMVNLSKHCLINTGFSCVSLEGTVKDIQEHIDGCIKDGKYLPLVTTKSRSFIGGFENKLATFLVGQSRTILYSKEEFDRLMVK